MALIADEAIDYSLLLKRIVRRRGVLLLVLALSVIASVALALTSKKFYLVTTKVIYQSSSKSTAGLSSLAALAGISVGGGGEDASAYLPEIVQSGDLLQTLLQQKWITTPTSAKKQDTLLLEELWEIEPDTTEADWQLRKKEGLLKRLLEGNYVQFIQDKKTSVITLTTEFEDPRVAYDVNVFLFQELNNTLVNKMNFKASANRKFIEGRLAEVKDDLRRSENNLRNYRERNRLRLDPGDMLEDSRLQRDVLINQEVMIQLQKQYEMAKIEEAKDMPVLDIIDSPRKPVEKSKPLRRKMVMGGFFIGLILGMLAALGYDLWQEKRHNQAV